MRKLQLLLGLSLLGVCGTFTSCAPKENVIKVCASELPHAEILNEVCKDLVAKKGYELQVSVLDWTLQNDGVANKDYDANYFQHIPYLETYGGTGDKELTATCKVHYEPLGIYKGNGNVQSLSEGKSFEICNDTSNAIRALTLLKEKNVLSNEDYNNATDGEKLNFDGKFISSNGVNITLISEELLVSSKPDYDFACLPCNTAYTGNVPSSLQVAKEDNPEQVSLKANVLAVRKNDYKNNEKYKEKIDVLTDALLSNEVSTFVKEKYLGAITCDSSSQIDLRSSI